MSSEIERSADLLIGTVESVSPDEIKVLLDIEAPQTLALNTGVPAHFPRLNGYLLISNEIGLLVGVITWLGVERAAFPRRPGLKDFGLIDLPFPLRKVSLTPVGTLIRVSEDEAASGGYALRRGVLAYPSVGDRVSLPTQGQLASIIEAHGRDTRVAIGTSSLAAGATVSVDPDKLFGRHLAVLGNTGSGKSGTVAGLIRWCVKQSTSSAGDKPNARFVVLDPDGEYLDVFGDLGARVFSMSGHPGTQPLTLPAWMWNSDEWANFTNATPQTQRPLLMQALRNLRAGAAVEMPAAAKLGRLARSYLAKLEGLLAMGVTGYAGFPASKNCGQMLSNMTEEVSAYEAQIPEALKPRLAAWSAAAAAAAKKRHWTGAGGKDGFNDFSEADLTGVRVPLKALVEAIPGATGDGGVSEDAPIPFDVGELADHLEHIAALEGGNLSQYVSTLTMRIRMLLADRRLGPIVAPTTAPTLEEWLGKYLGEDDAKTGPITVIDLSLIPAEVIHLVIAVAARLIFEGVQRYRKVTGKELPTVLVLEEAHTFVRASHESAAQDYLHPAEMCRRTFERIAREGRKFGLGLVIASQRPSELSQTVLAQCNTFLLHRIVNDRDQDLVRRLVPDNLGGLLAELPSLPTRHAILLGWASPAPVLVEITELTEEQRPHSSDPAFWSVWTKKEARPLDWAVVRKDWTE